MWIYCDCVEGVGVSVAVEVEIVAVVGVVIAGG